MSSVLTVNHEGGIEKSPQDILQRGFQRLGKEIGALNQVIAIEEEEAKKDIEIREIIIMIGEINAVNVKAESIVQTEVREETLHTIGMGEEIME